MLGPEIYDSLKELSSFRNVYARDQLPKITSFPASLVINTHTSDGPGEHWVAVFINENGFGEYFDSYGIQPLYKEFIEFLDNNCSLGWCYSTVMLQGLTSMTCGHYCILFCYMRALGISLCKIIRLFSNNFIVNDKIITTLYKTLIKN